MSRYKWNASSLCELDIDDCLESYFYNGLDISDEFEGNLKFLNHASMNINGGLSPTQSPAKILFYSCLNLKTYNNVQINID